MTAMDTRAFYSGISTERMIDQIQGDLEGCQGAVSPISHNKIPLSTN